MAVSAGQAGSQSAECCEEYRAADGGRKAGSSLNAVTHGLRAETLVLLDEDPQALEDRREAWRGLPSARRTTSSSGRWMTRSNTPGCKTGPAEPRPPGPMPTSRVGVDQAVTDEKEVEELGRRLFKDRLGPLTFYPTDSELVKRLEKPRIPTTSYAGDDKDDPDRPAGTGAAPAMPRSSAASGCSASGPSSRRSSTRARTGSRADKLKAVRLLGRQPLRCHR